jgi:REP element-mobilizing transposase RayT
MDQPPYAMDQSRRDAVLASLRERCAERHWNLWAAHVRTNHVHLVVETEARPERVMNDLKSFASLCLNRKGLDQPNRKRWARHGSTRWLWKREDVSAAIRYVVDGQGDPMAVFQSAKPLL